MSINHMKGQSFPEIGSSVVVGMRMGVTIGRDSGCGIGYIVTTSSTIRWNEHLVMFCSNYNVMRMESKRKQLANELLQHFQVLQG